MSDWHASPVVLVAYAAGPAGGLDDATAWSVEAHLTSCALCRAELAAVVAGGPSSRAAAVVAAARERVVAGLAGPPAVEPVLARGPGLLGARLRRARTHAAWLVRPSSLVAVLLAVLAAAVLALSARLSPDVDAAGSTALLWLLAPALPLAGVVLCSAGEGDPCREVVLSTPSAGLRLVLWRTAAVLAVAVPLALVAGFALGPVAGGWPVLWLVPCLALTATTLALGTALPLERAAVAVAALWCAAVAVPAVIAAGTDLPAVLAFLAGAAPSPADLPLVAGAAAQTTWAVLAVVALACLVIRRSSYERLPPAAVRSAA